VNASACRSTASSPRPTRAVRAARSSWRARSPPGWPRWNGSTSLLGDDIVDLREPDAGLHGRHPRFAERVFTRAEQNALRAAADPHALAAALWAAKEAGYKLARKRAPATVFAPRHFEVWLEAPDRGWVEHAGLELPLRLDADAERVHAIAAESGTALAGVRAGIAALPAPDIDPSGAVRALVQRDVAAKLGAAPDALRIERRGRVPWLWPPGAAAPLQLSLSHHGRYVAFACMLPPGGRRA
jgi:hypothetical protein